MINNKILNITGAVLDKYQLENYLEKVASDHVLQKYSDKSTYPIPRLKNNFKFITKTYELLNNNIKMGINIHPGGEWILDNYYIIEECEKNIEKELTLENYVKFIGLKNSRYSGIARIYVLASEIVAYTDGKIDSNNLKYCLEAYQRKKTLNMDEIWNIGIFIQIALIENIRNVCEKIYSSQMQKYRVENIVERLVENKEKTKFQLNNEYQSYNLGYGVIKYPFIEYMSYRLKKYGRKAISYLKVLEEQVNKMGTSVSEVIKKEHFDIANAKVTIGNSIRSIKEIQRVNFLEIFEKINGVEEILRSDPADVYSHMDYKTKNLYRNKIKELSIKTKISEIYIASKAYELASNVKTANNKSNPLIYEKKSHIGYYLVSEGKEELIQVLENKGNNISKNTRFNLYLFFIYGISAILGIGLGGYLYNGTKNIILSLLFIISSYIPLTEILTKITNTILCKKTKSNILPKMDFSKGIPSEYATFVVIPTIINDEKKIKELFERLEVYYLANKSENIYFALLGDCNASDKELEDNDTRIIKVGLDEVERLNKKYGSKALEKFQFIYRKRKWNDGEGCYLGWERKRGLLNQFNEYILGNEKNCFRVNTIEEWKNKDEENYLPTIKYIITLDSDTNLVFNSGLELIGAMAHVLNRPIIDENKNIVINGYGIMQPRIGINLQSGNKSIYTKIFAGLPGTDLYANAISDVYQDNFNEGIFTGKGIYDLKVFSQVLKNQIPENTVLSHDLLEGSYLRCGLVSDVVLLDDYPFRYNSNMSRVHRWIRGDWQIIGWLKKYIVNSNGEIRLNPLNRLSKFKIFDNLRRSLIEVALMVSFLVLAIISYNYNISTFGIAVFLTISIFIQLIIDIILKKENFERQRTFTGFITGIKASFYACLMNFLFLPHKAYLSFNAIVNSIYRMKFSKKHLLEWVTSEETEKMSKTNLVSYIKMMWTNIVAGAITIWFTSLNYELINPLIYIIAVLWIIAPIVAWYISKEIANEDYKLSENELKYVKEIGKRTWKYFENYMNKENNYLPPDNYQENRKGNIVNRTSSTNIGLGIMAVISACDLEYINLNTAIDYLEQIISTVQRLQKWNGHLLNWYNTKTLECLYPRYVSTVDSGNFVGYLYTAKQFVKSVIDQCNESNTKKKLDDLYVNISNIIDATDFSYLYDEEKGIFSIGFNIEENKLTDSYYDLLASEARQASIVAIAKKDVPIKHWSNLSRSLTSLNGYKGLVSWSGTAFEYLMPNVNIPKYQGSLLDESSKFLIMSQKEYCRKLGIPWGISEAAFNLKDLNSNYQYKAFGIPWLGLKRGLADELNITPYASILAICDDTKEVIDNLKLLEKEGMYNKYGFYEALDYTRR